MYENWKRKIKERQRKKICEENRETGRKEMK